MTDTKPSSLDSVGIRKIDGQHNRLQKRIEDLVASILRRDDVDDVLARFVKLYKRWHRHSRVEERFLRRKGSPRLNEMQTEHARIRHRIAVLSEEYEANPEEFAVSEAVDEIRTMLTNHVSRYDAPAFRDLANAKS